MPAVHIREWPTPVESRRGTILDAALRGGVPVPHQCCSGQCGTCKCRLLKGRVKHDAFLPEALSDREVSDGWVLACRARPKTDVEVDYGGALDLAVPPRARHAATVKSCARLTDDIHHLVLTLDDPPLAFLAGQFVQLRFGDLPPRSYSMASLPGDEDLEFYIREMPGGKVSGHIARQLAVGDSVALEGPCGQAYLRAAGPAAIIAAAGGSGLAPILAIARDVARREIPCPFHLYFGVRRESDLFARSALEDLAAQNRRMTVHFVLSDQSPVLGTPQPGTLRHGLPHAAIAADFSDLSCAHVYSAGPPPMVDAVERAVLDLGSRAENVHSDPFTIGQATAEGTVVRAIRRSLRFFRRSTES